MPDVACGTGNAALPAARAGAHVTGLDLVPELLEAGRADADAAGLEVEWVEGDAEQLPFEDDSFERVFSTFGHMFAPRHRVTADEMARVCTYMSSGKRWTFFTNHFHVLLVVARHPDARLRSVADEVGVTERAAHRILRDLADEGYLTVTKQGRRNHYRLNEGMRLRHEANTDVPLQPLISVINDNARDLHPGIAANP